MSFVRHMFRSKKSSSNKENDPQKRSTIGRTSFQGDLERIGEESMLSEHLPRRHLELLASNPYSIVTEPKRTRGPSSCPGGVQRDRFDQHRALRSSNRREKQGIPIDEPFDWEEEEEQYDLRDEKIQKLQSKLSRSKMRETRLQDEVTRLADELNDAKEEEFEWRKRASHYERKCEQLKLQLDMEKKRLRKMSGELRRAQRTALDLEGDSGNDSSLLMITGKATYGKSRLGESGGVEALTTLNEPLYENEKSSRHLSSQHRIPNDTPEARFYRGNEMFDETECPREHRNHDEMVLSRQNTNVTLKDESIGRSSSETELNGDSASNSNQEAFRLKSTPHRLRVANEPFIASVEVNTSGSSDEERYVFFERQLRHKGDVVRYNPPRTQVSQRHFRPKFGKWERDALSEFNYLMDLSTDVSGLVSSPEARH